MKLLHIVAFLLVVIGAINWGLVGLANYNLVEMLFGSVSGLVQLVYVLVGASGVVLLVTHKSDCKVCPKM
ncbi:MAG TPA: DUF378 domain-containing protein [Candidatus Pacebacteria bacterium]|nr:MAG: hypothetical protein UX00_C0015G0014 [Microgenomates group bacterium GW2011_GWB1_45_17]KKU24031.1 MAG: hypothetical protein UX36_C0002G0014 [Microgenomates group bacterium GW2011_GWC1_46_15]HAV14875.1 DUF378 domain-containing protein [Candidatus Paceibacterota bacterium]HCR11629.1 DUF378 domain-containing protein [Candidatus Paceibacterota bacterium]HCR93181.1 DUF378 domain-containing protein [Candidatus Paceibacterota bacterium]